MSISSSLSLDGGLHILAIDGSQSKKGHHPLMLEIVDLVLEGVRDEVHEHQLLLATCWTSDPGLFLLVLGQKVGQVPVNPRLVSNLIKVRSGH